MEHGVIGVGGAPANRGSSLATGMLSLKMWTPEVGGV